MTAARAAETEGRPLGLVGRVALTGVVLGGLLLASIDRRALAPSRLAVWTRR